IRSLSMALILALHTIACHTPPVEESTGGELAGDANIPEFSYLLPAPAETNSESNQLKELLSRPVLDPAPLEQLALEREAESRRLFAQRQQSLIAYICALPTDHRIERVRQLGMESRRQFHRWLAASERFQRSLTYHLNSMSATADSRRWQQPLRTVETLRRERQASIQTGWQELFQRLEADDCADESIQPVLPVEQLYLPYYIALYRFFVDLPLETRLAVLDIF
ncbi:MAG: hypothetical protein KDK34_00645, partial [Leptospiraceae bacterium]|nr:hypothetical protein [Leptospiraceae bacterium]